MVEWLAGNRIRGTSTERTSTTGFNPVTAVAGGWKELARTTLGSAANDISVTSIPDKRYYMILHSHLSNGTSMRFDSRWNGISSTTYADRRSANGGSDNTAVNTNELHCTEAVNTDEDWFGVDYMSNLSAKEKLMMGNHVGQNTSGAGTAPKRVEYVFKNTLTGGLINRIDYIRQAGTGQMDTNSEIVVLGWDPADTHTTNFWEELASVDLSGGTATTLSSGTFTAKKYLWIQFFVEKSVTGDIQPRIRVGNGTVDSGNNYAIRLSVNNATDYTAGSKNSLGVWQASNKRFENMFIVNNSANEKLVISHGSGNNTAGSGVAPDRSEFVGKWANTSNQINIVELSEEDGFTLGTTTQMKVWGSN